MGIGIGIGNQVKLGLSKLGLVAEYRMQKRNLLKYSEDLLNAVWTPLNCTITSLGNGIFRLTATADVAYMQLTQFITIPSLPAKTIGAYEVVNNPFNLIPKLLMSWSGGANQGSNYPSGYTGKVSTTTNYDGTGNSLAVKPLIANPLTGQYVDIRFPQLNEGTVLRPYEKSTENQVLQDSSGKGNSMQLGSAGPTDSNDPFWEGNRLLFGGDDFTKSPLFFDHKKDFTLYFVVDVGAALPTDTETYFSFGDSASANSYLTLSRTIVGDLRLHYYDASSLSVLSTSILIAAANVVSGIRLCSLRRVGNTIEIKDILSGQVATTTILSDVIFNQIALGCRLKTLADRYLVNKAFYLCMIYAKATTLKDDKNMLSYARKVLKEYGVTII